MTETQRAPYEQVIEIFDSWNFFCNIKFWSIFRGDLLWDFQMALKNKERYAQEMEVHNQKKDEEAANLKKEDEELMKLRQQEALQLLKKKEKTENLIKVCNNFWL